MGEIETVWCSDFSEASTPTMADIAVSTANADPHDQLLEQFGDQVPILGAITLSRKRKSAAIRSYLRKNIPQIDAHQLGQNRCFKASRELLMALRQLATSGGGLVRDEHRMVIWPLLAEQTVTEEGSEDMREDASGSDESDYESARSSVITEEGQFTPSIPVFDLGEPAVEDLKTHKEWNQVELDVHRTLARFPPNISDEHRSILQTELSPLIVRVLWDDPNYRYYQGFHDVCLTLLLVLGSVRGLSVCRQLASRPPFRNYLCEPLEETVPREIGLIYVILSQTDPELEYYLRRAELGTLFGLSWMLTWFAHSLDRYDSVVRLYDLFLASHPLMPVYFAAALVLFRSSEILDQCECDMAPIHSLLSKLPRSVPLEALIADAQDLFLQFPPKRLQGDLLLSYSEEVSRQKESGKMPESFGRRRQSPADVGQKAFRMVFWAGTVGATAWYLYAKYGIREMSWMQLL